MPCRFGVSCCFLALAVRGMGGGGGGRRLRFLRDVCLKPGRLAAPSAAAASCAGSVLVISHICVQMPSSGLGMKAQPERTAYTCMLYVTVQLNHSCNDSVRGMGSNPGASQGVKGKNREFIGAGRIRNQNSKRVIHRKSKSRGNQKPKQVRTEDRVKPGHPENTKNIKSEG